MSENMSEGMTQFNWQKRTLRGYGLLMVASLFLLGFYGGGDSPSSVSDDPYRKKIIVTTTSMIGEPLRRIGGGRMTVMTLMKEGVDPHLYRPTRSDIALLAQADIIVWTGPSLEAPLRRPIQRLQQYGKSVITLLDHIPQRELHVSEEGHIDPHVWMDPVIWSDAMKAAIDRIGDADLGNAAFYSARARIFQKRIARLHLSMDRSLQTIPQKARVLLTAHDAFFYFGKRYNFEVRGIQGMSTESEAGLYDINELVSLVVKRNIPALFAESSVNPKYLTAIIEGTAAQGHHIKLGGTLYADSMGAAGTRASSYPGMLAHNVRTIIQAIYPTNTEKVSSTAKKQHNILPRQKPRDETTVAATPMEAATEN